MLGNNAWILSSVEMLVARSEELNPNTLSSLRLYLYSPEVRAV
jgi:hypothetical protein